MNTILLIKKILSMKFKNPFKKVKKTSKKLRVKKTVQNKFIPNE